MKNLVFSIIVICALAIAGVGGTLADFSDSETEVGDKLQAGSLDLKANDANDPDVLPFTIDGIIPEKLYDVTKTVSNVGTIDGWLYIHFKNVLTSETNDKDFTPEPETVAELGGIVGGVEVDGIGVTSDFDPFLTIEIRFGPHDGDLELVDLSAYEDNGIDGIQLSELESNQILIDKLVACGSVWDVNSTFKLVDAPEDYLKFDYFDEEDPHEVKWEWWPTNAFQGDSMTFDIMFELLQTDYTPPGSV